jgi:hypothetical protein
LTYYIELWVRQRGGNATVTAEVIDALDAELMDHPELYVGDWVVGR